MKLQLIRTHRGNATIGSLFLSDDEVVVGEALKIYKPIGTFECFIIEPNFPGRNGYIPEGIYNLVARRHGSHYEEYQKYQGHEAGMIQVANVPGRDDILFHIGNYPADTKGCLCTGTEPRVDDSYGMCVFGSTEAYLHLYPQVMNHITAGIPTILEVIEAIRK